MISPRSVCPLCGGEQPVPVGTRVPCRHGIPQSEKPLPELVTTVAPQTSLDVGNVTHTRDNW